MLLYIIHPYDKIKAWRKKNIKNHSVFYPRMSFHSENLFQFFPVMKGHRRIQRFRFFPPMFCFVQFCILIGKSRTINSKHSLASEFFVIYDGFFLIRQYWWCHACSDFCLRFLIHIFFSEIIMEARWEILFWNCTSILRILLLLLRFWYHVIILLVRQNFLLWNPDLVSAVLCCMQTITYV